MDEFEAKLARLSCWKRPVRLTPLVGGLTNISYVADDGREKFVVRCGGDIPVHHVFRDRERAAARAAHAAGISPEIVHVEPGITVMRHVEGHTFTEEDMRTNLARLVPLLRTCHAEVGRHLQGPPNMFWVFHVIRDYVRAAGADAKYLALADALEARQVPLPIVFGHHDLLPGNVLDDGERLWLIDWEYGAFGTAMFDLANLSANGGFDAAQDELLLAGYFQRPVGPELKGAFAAMKAASALREALWAMVSDIHLRMPGVDYKAHAAEYLRRLERLLA